MKKTIVPGLCSIFLLLLVTGCPAPTDSQSNSKAITSFGFISPEVTGVIDETNKTITVSIPYGTSPVGLVASFVSTGTSVLVGSTEQITGKTKNDFTGIVTYTVQAENGTEQDYKVAVPVFPSSETDPDSPAGYTKGLLFTLTSDGLGYSVSKGTANTNGSVVIPETWGGLPVTEIGKNAFVLCELTDITIPKSITTISDFAFYSCPSLDISVIPNSIKIIGSFAFANCGKLTGITIPVSVTEISMGAFADTNVAKFIVDASNTSFKDIDGVLYSKDGTELNSFPPKKANAYTIPEGAKTIGSGAFYDCRELTDVSFPSSLLEIGHCAFTGCISLTSIAIPQNVSYIYGTAFQSCEKLQNIKVDSLNTYFKDIDGVLYDKAGTELHIYPYKNEESYIIPDGVTEIWYDAFSMHRELKNVTLPDGLEYIGWNAFTFSGLTDVIVPATVTCIFDNAFGYCTALSSMTLSSDTLVIGRGTFLGCQNLKTIYVNTIVPPEITLSSPLESSGLYFYDCSSLTAIKVPAASVAAYKSAEGWKEYADIIVPQ